MTANTKLSPYYDDFDAAKKYIQILAVPGRAEQAREFTQIQTIMLDVIKRLSNVILKDGSIVSGMSFTITGNKLTVHPGKVYLDGIIHDFDGETITIQSFGEENVGVKLEKTIVTEANDNTLRDPAQGYANYGQAGAHRLKASVKITLNDNTAPTIYRFMDGTLQLATLTPEIDVINDSLARRTFDESGNYKVRGLNLWVEKRDEKTLALNVEAGKAYIMGYEIEKPSSVKVVVDKALDTRAVLNEPKVFSSGVLKYPLNNNPVKQIKQLTANVEVTETITRGNIGGGIDYLPKTPVIQIVKIVQSGTNFEQGVDYQLTNDGVNWSLNGKEPDIGSSYTVTYRYNKIMKEGPEGDFQLTYTGEDDKKVYQIDFSKNGDGDKPVPTTTFTVDYDFYLARKDLVSIDRQGNIIITKGQSDIARLITNPVNNNPNILNLGMLYLPPNSDNVSASSSAVSRVSMADIQSLAKRIEDIEYNQAISALDEEAMVGENVNALKGIFSDGFFSIKKGDLSHSDFNATYSLETGEIMLPTNSIKTVQPSVSDATSQIKVWGRLVTAPYKEEVVVEQLNATTTLNVNPYNVFNKIANISLNPEVDNWIDEEKIVIEKVQAKTYQVHRWWYHGGSPSSAEEKMLQQNLKLDAGQSWGGWGNITGTLTETSVSKVLLDEAVTFMRQREVTVTLENLLPLADNLECLFDGIRVNLTPVGGTSVGTKGGTIKANSKGEAKGKFTVPAGVRTGKRPVVIKNDNNQAQTTYTAEGRRRIVEEQVLRTRVTVLPYDPLAQTFQLMNTRAITSVGLYFATKDPENNVTVQIRNTVNGYPGQVIYGETVLTPEKIQTSENGTTETRVHFDDPIVCNANENYCIVILTESDKYSVFIATLGDQDLATGHYLTRQPYVGGTLFSSSNAITWTAHQTQDLTFKIYAAKFEEHGVIEFEPIQSLGADRLVVLSDYLTLSNTGCTWEIKINDGAYQPIGNYEDVELSLVASKVQLRATFKADAYMSPVLALDSFSLIGFLTAQNGAYVGKETTLSQPYKTVKQIFEAYVPSGCTVIPKFTHNGTDWITPRQTTTEQVDNNYTRYTYEYTIVGEELQPKKFRPKLELKSPSALVKPRARKFMNIIK